MRSSSASRKEKPQQGVPKLAQGKSAPSGRSPGFHSGDIASAECSFGVPNSVEDGRNRTNSVSASVTLLRYTRRTARPMKMRDFLPRAAAQFAFALFALPWANIELPLQGMPDATVHE
jgi:hypothetical protein